MAIKFADQLIEEISNRKLKSSPTSADGHEFEEWLYEDNTEGEIHTMIGNRYKLHEDESELLAIEKDLAKYLNVPYVKCTYDIVHSHKYFDVEELISRIETANETDCWDLCDYVINFAIYYSKKSYESGKGNIYELLYLTGNADYIVVTGLNI